MKKYFFLISVAALAMTACTNESEEYVGSQESKEIAFMPIAQPSTRSAVDVTNTGVFPTTSTMQVAAYDAEAGANYFAPATFSNVAETATWTGGKYWPLSPATLNFLAYAEFVAGTDGTVTWNATNPASDVTFVMSDNSTRQTDLMYACGTGTVSQTSNTLSFPTSDQVAMVFKHAQALIIFNVVGNATAVTSGLTINDITLNSVSCNGTYAVTHANWNKTKAQRDAADPAGSLNGSVSGTWSAYGDGSDITAVVSAGYSALTTSSQEYGTLMVVPNKGIASFTIHYSLGGNNYAYTYTPASTSLAQATKYIYNITLNVHEIIVAPTVENWGNGSTVSPTVG